MVGHDLERGALLAALRARCPGEATVLYPGAFVHVTPSFFFQHVVYVDRSHFSRDFFMRAQAVLDVVNQHKQYRQRPFIRLVEQDYTADLPVPEGSFDLGDSAPPTPRTHPTAAGGMLPVIMRSMGRLVLLAALAGIPCVGCSGSGKSHDGGMPGAEAALPDAFKSDLLPTDGGYPASADAAIDEAGLDIAIDINRSADDARDTPSSEDAECYPGLVASCMVAVPTYDPCSDPKCQGYSRFCTNGRWSWVHCDPIVEPPLAKFDAAVERGPVDLGLDSSPVDLATTLDTSCGLHDGRRFAVGAVFSDGCGCCICTASGGVCYGGNFCTRFVDGAIESFMSLPPCRSDDDCSMMIRAGAVCVFDPGCSPGQGRCVSTPLTVCSTYTGDIAHEYCGCDGQTFQVGVPGAKNFPDRPYAHLGTCP